MSEKLLCPFGEILVQARKERGITQYRLAKLVQRNARYISQLEHNRREPKLSTIIMLARALQMDAGDLVREVDKLMPEWSVEPAEESSPPKKAKRSPKKKVSK